MDPVRIRQRAVAGMVAFAVRTVLVQGLVFGSGLVLARMLEPADFGAYASTLFVLEVLSIVGDAGLGAALVRQREEPGRLQLATVFWAQLALGLFVVGGAWAVSPLIRHVYPSLPNEGEWLLRVLAASFLFTMLRATPTLLLERELEFGKLAAIEVVTSIAYHSSLIVLALLGYRTWAFIIGAIVYGVVGVTSAYIARPFRPALAFDGGALKPLLKFGLTVQVKSVLAFLNSAVTPVYVGSFLGMGGLGLVTWAQQTAAFPLKLVDIVGKASFPVYSRLRDDPTELAAVVARNLQIGALGTLFFVGLVLGVGPELTAIVFSSKWLVALPALYVLAASLALGFVTPLLATALDAIGKPGIVARLSLGMTALNWVVVLATGGMWSQPNRVFGFAVAYSAHVVLGGAILLYIVSRLLPRVRIAAAFRAGIPGGLAVAALGHWVLAPRIGGWPSLVLAIGVLVMAFASITTLVDRDVRLRVSELFRRSAPAA